jgi:peptidoglycan/xylan/chitin deacetylase (PgdA/CDA1 family)
MMGERSAIDRSALAQVLRAGYQDQDGETWRIIRMSDDGGVVATPLNDAFIEVLAASYEDAASGTHEAAGASRPITVPAIERLLDDAPPLKADGQADDDLDPISRAFLRHAFRVAFDPGEPGD